MSLSYTHTFDTTLYKGAVTVPTGLFINGQFVHSVSQKTIEIINPVNEQVITQVSIGDAKDVDIAVDIARKAYKSSWGLRCPGNARGKLLSKLADLMEQHHDELAALEALNTGKHYFHTKSQDIVVAIEMVRYFAGWADKNQGQTLETNEAKFAYTRHEPIGVCGLIIPWNFPLMIAMCKVAPALATGNAVVLKPSEITPLTILKFAELTVEAGFPPGVFNVITGYGHTAGQAMADHMNIDKVSFTGSTLVGRKIMEASSKSNLNRLTLELGGKNPSIIFDDAELDQAIKWSAAGVFHNSGQMCLAGSRIFVQEGIYDEFLKGLVAAAQGIKQGDGFDPSSHQGPVVSKAQLDRVLAYVESGKAEGAKILAGGARNGTTGYFVQPTVFVDVNRDMKIVREEVFGPVCTVVKFKTEEEATELANDTLYGLSCVIFSQNITRALRVAHSIEAGQAYINSAAMGCAQVAFGGVKQSGFGIELGQYALEDFSIVKAVHVNLGMRL